MMLPFKNSSYIFFSIFDFSMESLLHIVRVITINYKIRDNKIHMQVDEFLLSLVHKQKKVLFFQKIFDFC